eukprot:CAMPEP_0178984600 /NCGR_PEP_ID=MMETSP0795-20121207/1699_1 /TAXON_ID=88552 /ORGANISM="Amoebophrya sp., Strain Ameob2" /LENGTH=172 /DNA_ID=CAMNT_0020675489 /DNA_START=236 /DNA_END=755 /DNA_ORIENTATION=+
MTAAIGIERDESSEEDADRLTSPSSFLECLFDLKNLCAAVLQRGQRLRASKPRLLPAIPSIQPAVTVAGGDRFVRPEHGAARPPGSRLRLRIRKQTHVRDAVRPRARPPVKAGARLPARVLRKADGGGQPKLRQRLLLTLGVDRAQLVGVVTTGTDDRRHTLVDDVHGIPLI